MIRIVICENERKWLEEIKAVTLSYLRQSGQQGNIDTYLSSDMLMAELEEGLRIDLLITDIEMDNYDGMALAAFVQEKHPECLVVFVTNYEKYALRSFDLDVFRYVLKKDLPVKLPAVLELAFVRLNVQRKDCFYFHDNACVRQISHRDILYFTREGKNVVFVTVQGNIIRTRNSVAGISRHFPKDEFMFIDRGYVVNLANVRSVEKDRIIMITGECLFLRKARAEEVKSGLLNFWRQNYE